MNFTKLAGFYNYKNCYLWT